jgi:hypothetical protein
MAVGAAPDTCLGYFAIQGAVERSNPSDALLETSIFAKPLQGVVCS